MTLISQGTRHVVAVADIAWRTKRVTRLAEACKSLREIPPLRLRNLASFVAHRRVATFEAAQE